MMKIALVYLCNPVDKQNFYMKMLPVDMLTLAAFLESKGFEVTLLTYSNEGITQIAKTLKGIKPDVLYVSVYTHNRRNSFKLIKVYRKVNPKSVIVVAGPFSTFMAEEINRRFKEIDFILKGEHELSFLKLLKNKFQVKDGKKIIESLPIKDISVLHGISEFSGDMVNIDPNEQFKLLVTSRGSVGNSNFNSYPRYAGSSVRLFPVKKIIDEIERIYKKYGVIYFAMRDENLTADKDHILSLCREIRSRKLYIMWNCYSRVDTIDEDLLKEMKLAGLERVQYNISLASQRLMDIYGKGYTMDQIIRAAQLTRKIGVYLTISLRTGLPEETTADIKNTINMMKKILPGECIVTQAAYYPGTDIYMMDREKGLIDDSVWFENDSPVISIINDENVRKRILELKNAAGIIREAAWYKGKNFSQHKRAIGHDCWVTDILEGDYYLDEEIYHLAEKSYRRVVINHPNNPWGFLRLGKVRFREGDFEGAEEFFKTVTEKVPSYYGGWLKAAESELALGKMKDARKNIDEAYIRNKHDIRILNIKKLLRSV